MGLPDVRPLNVDFVEAGSVGPVVVLSAFQPLDARRARFRSTAGLAGKRCGRPILEGV
jgi:hypothetical protein